MIAAACMLLYGVILDVLLSSPKKKNFFLYFMEKQWRKKLFICLIYIYINITYLYFSVPHMTKFILSKITWWSESTERFLVEVSYQFV